MILDLTSFFFGSLSYLRHLLSSNVLCFTCLVLCCFLSSQRSQVEGVRLKFESLRSKVTMSSQRYDEVEGMNFKHLSVFFVRSEV